MKCLQVFSVFLCFDSLVAGNEQSLSASDGVFQVTNAVDEDYVPVNGDGTSEVSSGAGIPYTWTWQPRGNEKNMIKFEPALSIFKDDEQSGSSEQETEEDDQDVGTMSEHVERPLAKPRKHEDNNQGDKKQSIEKKRHLAQEKRLQKTNWCFKKNGDKDSLHRTRFKKTEVCCRGRRQCRATQSMYVHNGMYPCSCDVNFYTCLKKANTKMATSTGQLYFNDRKIVCYREAMKKPCTKLYCKVNYTKKTIGHF